MQKICEYLEKAFLAMNILYKKTMDGENICYRLDLPDTSILYRTAELIIDRMFIAEFHACTAKGISPKMRGIILEKINEFHGKFRLIRLSVDQNNDLYACQQMILVGDEAIMCKQIMTKLLVFYDLHKRTAQEILKIIQTKNDE